MVKQLEIKGKKKHWYSILPTSNFRMPEIGETFTSDPSNLVGKTVAVSGMDLMHDPRKGNIKIIFKITEIKDNKALTEIKSYEVVPNSIKRMIHQGKEKIDASFKLETKDNIKVIAKPILITRAKTSHAVLSKIRKNSEDFLRAAVKKQNYQENINLLLENKIQVQLREYLKKTYPLAACHIRVFKKQ